MNRIWIAAAAAAGVIAPALAHHEDGGKAAKLSPSSQMLVDRFKLADTNHDGNVGRSEWEAHMKARFAGYDKNHDGRLDAAEVAGLVASMGQTADMTPGQFIKSVDKDGDGQVSEAEYVGRGMGRFDAWDTSKDGVLSKAEQDAEIARMEAMPPK